jgi:hypothetical protein
MFAITSPSGIVMAKGDRHEVAFIVQEEGKASIIRKEKTD